MKTTKRNSRSKVLKFNKSELFLDANPYVDAVEAAIVDSDIVIERITFTNDSLLEYYFKSGSTGHAYLLEINGYMKIGYTKDTLYQRWRHYPKHLPPGTLIKAHAVIKSSDAPAYEYKLHTKFENLKLSLNENGDEWYRIEGPLLAMKNYFVNGQTVFTEEEFDLLIEAVDYAVNKRNMEKSRQLESMRG